MSGVNKAILLGRLGADPEVRYTQGGGAVVNASLATSDQWKDKSSGQQQERTEWHRLVFFGRLAEVAGEYLRKGAQIYVEGSIHTRKWQGSDGLDRYTTEIKVKEMQMLGSRDNDTGGGARGAPGRGGGHGPGRGGGEARGHSSGRAVSHAPAQEEFEDDIPF